MAKDANADIAELERFHRSLVAYADALQSESIRMVNAVNQVNQSWNDGIQERFMDSFEQNLSNVYKMYELVVDHGKYVYGKINQLKEYAQSGLYM